MLIGAEFSKLSIKRYKPVGGLWWVTQIDNLNFKLPFYPRKNFRYFFHFRIFLEKFCSECLLSCVDKIITLKDDFTPGMTLCIGFTVWPILRTIFAENHKNSF